MKKNIIFILIISLILSVMITGCGKKSTLGMYSDPVPPGETVTYKAYNKKPFHYDLEMTLTEIIRGDEAYDLVVNSDGYDKDIHGLPDDSSEYILAKMKINVLKIRSYPLQPLGFKFVSESGVLYKSMLQDLLYQVRVKPEMEAIFKETGNETEGYVLGVVAKDDIPFVVFYGNDNGVWFLTQDQHPTDSST